MTGGGGIEERKPLLSWRWKRVGRAAGPREQHLLSYCRCRCTPYRSPADSFQQKLKRIALNGGTNANFGCAAAEQFRWGGKE